MLGTKQQLLKIFPVCNTTLNFYRQKRWIEGIHFVKINSRHILYNLELIQDYLNNLNNPKNHQRAINNYMKTLQKR